MFKKIIWLGFPSKGKNAKDIHDHVANLVASGAGEFFTGYNPPYWYEKFGFEVSPNGRFAEHEQITDFETLSQVVQEVHSYNLEIFWNLNFRYYTDETMPFIERMYEEFLQAGLDGIICGNIGILEFLKKKNYTWKINISTILAVYNSEAIRFLLENYKINKIILSREVTLKEIEQILTEFPDVTFEVFGEGDFCRYNNGLCFAEHKYTTRDICTVVVNDLIVKKRYRPDFKKIVLDPALSNIEKIHLLQGDYEDVFAAIESTLEAHTLSLLEEQEAYQSVWKLLKSSLKRVDLFYDAQKPISDPKNKAIISFLKGIKFIQSGVQQGSITLEKEDIESLTTLEKEIESSIQSGIAYLKSQTLKLWGEAKLKAQELSTFYAKGDTLNLYSYLFFSKFKNLDTVKFPTRGRTYAEKIALIEKVLQEGKVSQDLIDRGVSPERTHYDLTYLFGDTLWFRKLVQSLK